MADPGKYRTKETLEREKEKDPIRSLAGKLDSLQLSDLRERIEAEVEEEIRDAVEFAENSPFPAPETAMDYVYAE